MNVRHEERNSPTSVLTNKLIEQFLFTFGCCFLHGGQHGVGGLVVARQQNVRDIFTGDLRQPALQGRTSYDRGSILSWYRSVQYLSFHLRQAGLPGKFCHVRLRGRRWRPCVCARGWLVSGGGGGWHVGGCGAGWLLGCRGRTSRPLGRWRGLVIPTALAAILAAYRAALEKVHPGLLVVVVEK